MRDVREAKHRFPGSPFVLGESLYVHTVAMLANRRDRGSTEDFLELRDIARADLEHLAKHPQYAFGLVVKAWYLDCFGSREEADAAWMKVLEDGNHGWHNCHAAATLFRSGDVATARKCLASDDTLDKIALGMVLSSDTERRSEARSIYEELRRRERCINFGFGTAMDVLVTLGPAHEIKSEAKKLLNDQDVVFSSTFDKEMVQFLAGRSDVERLLDSCGRNGQKAMAHFAIARLRIAEGDWQRAAFHLNECKAIRVLHISDYYWAKAYLDRYASYLGRAITSRDAAGDRLTW